MNYISTHLEHLRGYSSIPSSDTRAQTDRATYNPLLESAINKRSLVENVMRKALHKIVDYLPPQESFSALKTFCKFTPNISKFLNSKDSDAIWKTLDRKLPKSYANVTKLDLRGSNSPRHESVESIKRRMHILDRARFIASLSQDHCSTIITIPACSIEQLESRIIDIAISHPKKMLDRALGAEDLESWIQYEPSLRELLQKSPLEKTKTFIFSDSIIQGSIFLSIKNKKALLKDNGLKETFPNTLALLITIIAVHVLKKKNLYSDSHYSQLHDRLIEHYTITQLATKGPYMEMHMDDGLTTLRSQHNFFSEYAGVGASATFEEL